VGLPPADFLVKPVRLNDLLDWLGRRLDLQWQAAPATMPPAATEATAAEAEHYPPAEALESLRELVGLGYLRGITRRLDQIESEHAAAAAFVARLRHMAREFQLDAMNLTLQRALDELRRA